MEGENNKWTQSSLAFLLQHQWLFKKMSLNFLMPVRVHVRVSIALSFCVYVNSEYRYMVRREFQIARVACSCISQCAI